MKLPVSEFNQTEHDGCVMHFQTRDCACECGHKGEKSLEDREMVFQPYVAPKKQIKSTEEDDES